jgi:hypothetical protein
MEKATISGGFFNLMALWGHASSGHAKTYELSLATTWRYAERSGYPVNS